MKLRYSVLVFLGLLFNSCLTFNSKDPGFKPDSNSGTQKENSALYLGNPSGAVKNEFQKNNYLIERSQFTLSYNESKHTCNWCAWHVDINDLGSEERAENFRADELLPEGFYRVKKDDYRFSEFGFDRGHMCPSADRTDNYDNNSATFYMTNMVPQAPNNNRNVWMNLEKFERQLVRNGYEVYIIAGVIGIGGENASNQKVEYITWLDSNKNAPSDNGIVVPAWNYKIIVVLEDGSDDLSRINEKTPVIAVNIPNTNNCSKDTGSFTGENIWKFYITSVDELENLTGYDFLSCVEDSVEKKLEEKIFNPDTIKF